MFEYVNLNYLKSISEGDERFQKEMIRIFLKQIPDFLANMRKYLSRKENEKLMKEAHTAKSSALIFMMEETGNILKEIKQLAEKNETEKISSLIDQVETALNGASRELSGYLQTE
jgi:HPt (histidine-containing phosphotransfer) domain-containing protein